MSKVYCYHCSQPTTYDVVKPRFCSSCGGTIGVSSVPPVPSVASSPPVRQPSNPRIKTPNVAKEDEDEEYVPIPRLNKLSVECDDNRAKGEKLGRIVATRDPKSTRSSRPTPSADAKSVLAAFQKEAGPVQRSESVGGEHD